MYNNNNNNRYKYCIWQTSYRAPIPENSPAGTSVIRLFATDGDSGDFGQVRYQLGDNPYNAFVINETTVLPTSVTSHTGFLIKIGTIKPGP